MTAHYMKSAPPTRTDTEDETDQLEKSWFIRLSGHDPIAGGGESQVFARPGKSSQLIKVHNTQHVEHLAASRSLKNRLRRWRGIGPYKTLLRLNRAYLDAVLKAAELGRPPPIAHQRGVLLTDLGLGVVVQKIRGEDGELAVTVAKLHRRGRVDSDLVTALTRFAGEMSAFHIIGNDLNPHNLVYETRHGRSRIVLVEGYGSRNLIPFRRWSRRVNDKSLSRRFQALAAWLDLTWDEGSWSFSQKDSEPGRSSSA
ncbi:YrbL family protein [Palleronia abyssalis]|uniref:PhoP regulatory network protein YrbL n=1 Tax=Palleronia abyssalis TaxID=1501240 RepID=A0A2R8C204_9RHOB|nr:YrbL family protein [Palleronia abyssalis]SPJ26448.1 hypothetical protein PAA8504_04309 [Palleronia abyssalis]